MPRLAGTYYGSIACLVFAVLFYLLSVSGVLFGGASKPNDLGVYAVTIITLGFGAGGLLLRKAKLAQTITDHA